MQGGGLGERGLAGREWEARPALGAACRPCPSQNVKQLYALVCETQRYSAVLDAVIASAGLLRAEKKLWPHLAKVSSGRGLSPTPGFAALSGIRTDLERM